MVAGYDLLPIKFDEVRKETYFYVESLYEKKTRILYNDLTGNMK